MNEIMHLLNGLSADQLDSVIMRANIMLEKKRKDEAAAAQRERERQRQELLEKERRRQEEIAELKRKLQELQNQKTEIPETKVNFVMYDSPRPNTKANAAETGSSPAQSKAPKMISCLHCHTMNSAGSAFCFNCGQRLSNPQATAQPQTGTKPSKISCPYCHQQNTADSIFCMNCGKKLIRA